MKTDVPTAQVPLPLAQDKRRRLTLEALADVDEGNAVDHRSVQAWADSLDGDRPVSLPR
ncbi:CopG family transcriptional regulator [Rhizobium leguminosarum]|uniref:CopG family transcriptional regulator n=1 Tax=Rhizobium leguminosarum TaxID=384 RepID=UPI000A644270|nr:CopG family transcriptional regulator [Rhizobium leguminosarum]